MFIMLQFFVCFAYSTSGAQWFKTPCDSKTAVYILTSQHLHCSTTPVIDHA